MTFCGVRFCGRYREQSGHRLLQRKRRLLSQSGHSDLQTSIFSLAILTRTPNQLNEDNRGPELAALVERSPPMTNHDPRMMRQELDVEPQQVVLGQAESADGGFSTDAGMRSVPVVSMQPVGQLSGSLT